MKGESRSLWAYVKQDSRWLTLSNMFSCARIMLAPIVAVGLHYQYWTFTFIIFIIAALTDLLDGYFARLWKEQTNLGRVLDPLADKLFLTTSLVALFWAKLPSSMISSWFVLLFIIREGMMIVGSVLFMYVSPNATIKPNLLGKIATFSYMIFIAWILCCMVGCWTSDNVSATWMIILLAFSFASLIQYVQQFLCLVLKYLFRKSE